MAIKRIGECLCSMNECNVKVIPRARLQCILCVSVSRVDCQIETSKGKEKENSLQLKLTSSEHTDTIQIANYLYSNGRNQSWGCLAQAESTGRVYASLQKSKHSARLPSKGRKKGTGGCQPEGVGPSWTIKLLSQSEPSEPHRALVTTL